MSAMINEILTDRELFFWRRFFVSTAGIARARPHYVPIVSLPE
jgi:hypothetical protein